MGRRRGGRGALIGTLLGVWGWSLVVGGVVLVVDGLDESSIVE